MNYTNEVDVKVEDEGTIVLFRPTNDNTREWLEANTSGTWFGGALVVEHGFAKDLIYGLAAEGFSTEYGAGVMS